MAQYDLRTYVSHLLHVINEIDYLLLNQNAANGVI